MIRKNYKQKHIVTINKCEKLYRKKRYDLNAIKKTRVKKVKQGDYFACSITYSTVLIRYRNIFFHKKAQMFLTGPTPFNVNQNNYYYTLLNLYTKSTNMKNKVGKNCFALVKQF